MRTIPAGSTPIPTTRGVSAGSSMDPAGQAADVAPSSSTILAADKGKAPMVDDSIPADLLTEQERVLKNLHDYQFGEDLAKKLQAEQEAEFPRLGMLLMRKRMELAEQSRVKPMNKTKQRDFMRDFVKNQSASVYNQGWTMKQVKSLSISQFKHEFEYIQQNLERSNLLNFKRSTFRPRPTLEAPIAKRVRQGVPQTVHAAASHVPASVLADLSIATDVSVSAVSTMTADVSPAPTLPAESVAEVHANESRPDENKTTFDASGSDDDPSPYAPYAGWEMVPTPLGSIHAYYDMEEHTKHFTSLRKLLHMVEATMERMLRHGLEVPKLLVGGDLTMAEQLVHFIKAALLNAQSVV
nr:hypothetical protein [Tanacetum cinerariifolium]